MSPQVQLDMEKMTDFCRRWGVRELALFGSVLGDDFRPDSDIDVLVSFSAIFGRNVDLVCREGIERSHNFIRRKAILSTAEVLYAA